MSVIGAVSVFLSVVLVVHRLSGGDGGGGDGG